MEKEEGVFGDCSIWKTWKTSGLTRYLEMFRTLVAAGVMIGNVEAKLKSQNCEHVTIPQEEAFVLQRMPKKGDIQWICKRRRQLHTNS